MSEYSTRLRVLVGSKMMNTPEKGLNIITIVHNADCMFAHSQ
jgi:hypothetical protein